MFTLMSNQITPSPTQNEIQRISGGQQLLGCYLSRILCFPFLFIYPNNKKESLPYATSHGISRLMGYPV